MNAQEKKEQRLKLLDDHIGQHLRDSEGSGELRAAPSYGKPLAFGDGYDETPAELRMPMKVLKDAGIVPHEVTMMREAAELRARIETSTDASSLPELQRRLALLQQAIALRLEQLRINGSR